MNVKSIFYSGFTLWNSGCHRHSNIKISRPDPQNAWWRRRKPLRMLPWPPVAPTWLHHSLFVGNCLRWMEVCLSLFNPAILLFWFFQTWGTLLQRAATPGWCIHCLNDKVIVLQLMWLKKEKTPPSSNWNSVKVIACLLILHWNANNNNKIAESSLIRDNCWHRS